MNQDVYGLTPRSAVLKRRSRRLRTAAAIVALLVIWLGYAVVTELAAELRAKSQQQAAIAAQGGPAWSAAPAKQVKLDKLPAPAPGAAVPLDGVPAAADAVAGALPGNFIAGAPSVVAAERGELENRGTHVPFLSAALHNGRLPGYSRRGAAGFNGGTGSSGGGGFGGGSRVESDAVDDSASGDSRVDVMGRREPGENAGGNDTGPNGNNVSNGNSGSNGNHGDGNNGSNGKHSPNGTPSANGGGDGKPTVAAGPQTVNDDEDEEEGDGSGQAVPTVPEPGSILLALGAAAAIVRHRRPRG